MTIVSTAGMAALEDKAAAVKNEPYEAQAVTEMKQTLADGSHIVQTTTATVARVIVMAEPFVSRNWARWARGTPRSLLLETARR